MDKKTTRWIFWLCIMSFVWILSASLAAIFTYNAKFQPSKAMAIISGVYLCILFLVIAVGNIVRVRLLMFMTSIYSIGACVRSVYGVLIATLIIDKPESKLWFYILDVITLPFTGFYYIDSLLTSHFVTEIYWIGLFCVSLMVLCFSLAGFMAVTGRNKKTDKQSNKQKYIDDIRLKKQEQIEQNIKFIEEIFYNDKK